MAGDTEGQPKTMQRKPWTEALNIAHIYNII